MREYEFRGQDKNGNWHYGSLVLATDSWYRPKGGGGFHREWIAERTFSNGGFINLAVRYCVKPETVGQYIGMKDKVGNKIYDGDILQVKFSDCSGSNCLVGWDDDTCSYGLMDSYSYQSKLEGYDFAKFSSQILQNFYNGSVIFNVIGNVFDNPELLKNK